MYVSDLITKDVRGISINNGRSIFLISAKIVTVAESFYTKVGTRFFFHNYLLNNPTDLLHNTNTY